MHVTILLLVCAALLLLSVSALVAAFLLVEGLKVEVRAVLDAQNRDIQAQISYLQWLQSHVARGVELLVNGNTNGNGSDQSSSSSNHKSPDRRLH